MGKRWGQWPLPGLHNKLDSIVIRVISLQEPLHRGAESLASITSLQKSQHLQEAQHFVHVSFLHPRDLQRENERHKWALNEWSHAKEFSRVICLWHLEQRRKFLESTLGSTEQCQVQIIWIYYHKLNRKRQVLSYSLVNFSLVVPNPIKVSKEIYALSNLEPAWGSFVNYIQVFQLSSQLPTLSLLPHHSALSWFTSAN